MKISNAATTLIWSALSLMSANAVNSGDWVQLTPNIEFQSKVDPFTSNPHMTRAKNMAIERMLGSQKKSYASFDSYDIGMEDLNQDWDDGQLAWHLLGFYVDCNSGGGDDHHRRELQEDHHDEGGDNGKNCKRNVLYAVYVDPNYEGGGVGEYAFYDQSTGLYKCYSGNCRAKMDCHSSDTTSWKLMGIFKIDNISQGNGWMEQLFKHAGVCYWGEDNYDFASAMREKLPDGCKQTDYQVNGNSLYMDVNPVQNAYMSLALYTDDSCTSLYTGSNYDVYAAAGTSSSNMAKFNKLLNGYKICQPCIAYDLSQDDFACYDKAGYTNCNQCMKFAIKAGCSAASPQDVKLAYRQSGLLPISNITDSIEMSAVKQLESQVLYDTTDGIRFLEISFLMFIACLTFYFVPTNIDGGSKKAPLLSGDDDKSAGTEEGSVYANSPPVSPSGLVLDCDPMRPKTSGRRSSRLTAPFNTTNGDGHDSDGNLVYSSDQGGEQSSYISESEATSDSDAESYQESRRKLLLERFT